VLLEDASDDRERRSVRAKPKVVGTHLAPGAGSDTVARITAEKMSEGLSQPVVVENRSGAGGMLANRYVAGGAPDGYTLLLVTGAYPAQAAVLKELSFDPLKDISMISLLMEYPFVLVARPDAPYKSVKELIAYAKRSAIQLNYASSGAGSVHHLTSELFNAMTGIELSPLTDARELWLCPFSTPMNRIYIYIA